MRLLHRKSFFSFCALFVLAMIAVLPGCATNDPSSTSPASPAPAVAQDHNALMDPLRVSDRIKIEFSGTPEPIDPVEEEVAADGTVNVQFAGHIQALGKTPAKLAKDIEDALVPKYFAHLSASVTPTGRFFYVGGEISQNGSGGRMLYQGPITVTRAIDAAGGFSPFANKKKVRLTRVDGTQIIVNCVKAIDHPEKDPPVYPGDRIYVPIRF
jgi:polysaccharide export outer membrane protein